MNGATDDRNRRILVIDDHGTIHEDFRKILAEDRGATVVFKEARVRATWPGRMRTRKLVGV